MLEADAEVDRREFLLSAASSVAAGERLTLLGPPGAGKTTILPVRRREQPATGQDFAFTVLDPPCPGPGGTRVSRPEEVPT